MLSRHAPYRDGAAASVDRLLASTSFVQMTHQDDGRTDKDPDRQR